jgi:uncharacterized protein
MAELPPGIGIEEVWLVEAPYIPDAAERRPAVRGEHLERILRLRDEGVVIEAGGATDFSKAVLLVRAESREAALRIVEEDVYTRAGVWTDFTVRPFGRAVRQDDAPTDDPSATR